MIIPKDLNHLDIYSPEELFDLVVQELHKPTQDLHIIQGCIDAGLPLDMRGSAGWTLLHEATIKGRLEAIQLLINAGADPNIRASVGGTSLNLAAKHGHLEITQLLINAGTALDVRDGVGWTSLHDAASGAHVEIVHLLFNAGANKYLLNNTGKTPWDVAHDFIRTNCPYLQP